MSEKGEEWKQLNIHVIHTIYFENIQKIKIDRYILIILSDECVIIIVNQSISQSVS